MDKITGTDEFTKIVERLTDVDATQWFVTFGYVHSDPPGMLTKKYLVVNAVDELTARAKIRAEVSNRWAFIYTAAEFAPQPEHYGLTQWKEI
jgi:hypothetical protein